jgi:hypothetical protein
MLFQLNSESLMLTKLPPEDLPKRPLFVRRTRKCWVGAAAVPPLVFAAVSWAKRKVISVILRLGPARPNGEDLFEEEVLERQVGLPGPVDHRIERRELDLGAVRILVARRRRSARVAALARAGRLRK